MSVRTDILKAAGMQFPDEVEDAMVALLDQMSQTDFGNLVTYTMNLSNQPPPHNNVALAYIAFQFRSGQE